jgi:2-amino-4-hydroxy-6-hydroxymethyldihydropteridine diphosphokinase
MIRRAYIGLGGNLGNRAGRLAEAIAAIGGLPDTVVAARSSVYESAPVGAADAQPDYFNAVVAVDTGLAPRALLEGLQRIEHDAGRTRVTGERNAARTLDLDILLIGDERIDEPGLHVPHPRMQERAFVLMPLAELAPEATIPGLGRVRELLPRVAGQRIERLREPLAPAA